MEGCFLRNDSNHISLGKGTINEAVRTGNGRAMECALAVRLRRSFSKGAAAI